jgi:hypothetical protein
MPERNPRLRNPATHKQLLIIESELNRRLLIEDGRASAHDLHGFGERAAYWRGVVTAGFVAFLAFQSKTEAPATGKRSPFGPFLDTLRLGASLWTTLRNGKERR